MSRRYRPAAAPDQNMKFATPIAIEASDAAACKVEDEDHHQAWRAMNMPITPVTMKSMTRHTTDTRSRGLRPDVEAVERRIGPSSATQCSADVQRARLTSVGEQAAAHQGSRCPAYPAPPLSCKVAR